MKCVDGKYLETRWRIDKDVSRTLGWEFGAIDWDFEASLEKFGGATWEIVDWGYCEIGEIGATKDEIFFRGTGFEEIFEEFNQS